MNPKYVAWNEVTLYNSAWLYDVHKTGAVSTPFRLDIYKRGVKRVNRSFRMTCGKNEEEEKRKRKKRGIFSPKVRRHHHHH